MTRYSPLFALITWFAASSTWLAGCTTAPRDYDSGTQVRESALLRPQAGYTGSELGVVVEESSLSASGDTRIITLSLPPEIGEISEVEIVDASGNTMLQKRRAIINEDERGNSTGVKIYVTPRNNFQFRLRLSTEQ